VGIVRCNGDGGKGFVFGFAFGFAFVFFVCERDLRCGDAVWVFALA
jgi:hypothetical protein